MPKVILFLNFNQSANVHVVFQISQFYPTTDGIGCGAFHKLVFFMILPLH
jgi:hypothetical protein